ncbi:MAG: cytochrome P450 [Myxococcales bacterium]|nr:cytochrome P450 [Myxococcales bacterium]MCB9735893.1 cytochrome P450 [Deltaproteobacteria bacterium]
MTTDALPLPPGSGGMPLLGETLPMLKDGYAFVRERVERHGPVFRTNVLFKKTAVLVGPDALGAFLDPANVTRVGGLPPHIADLFGKGAINQIDGPVHTARKTIILAALDRAALESYTADVVAITRDHLTRWRARGEERVADAGKRLAIALVGKNIFDLAEGPDLDALYDDVQLIGGGFSGLPVNLPGTAFNKALKAKKRLFARYAAIVADHRARPREDGLSRMLAAEVDGTRLDDEAVVRELHHLLLAGYIVWGMFIAGLLRLGAEPALADALRAEVGALPEAPDARALLHLPGLAAFAQEVKRTTPMIPIFFGVAARDFEVAGHRVPAGWRVLWAIHASNNSGVSAFSDPSRFDPARFGEARREDARHPHALSPQGSGPPTGHRCAGVEYSTLLLHAFFAELLRVGRFTVPEQDLRTNAATIPPEYPGGVRVRFEG